MPLKQPNILRVARRYPAAIAASMDRSLIVDVKHKTWPGPGQIPAFPSAFHAGRAIHQINMPSVLLMIGYLTTPTSSTGVSLSEFWAWVRYLAAIAGDPDLRLTRSFADLDAHQKTILSDDFGMGVPMVWLSQRLPLSRIVDGRYFMNRIAASVGASQRRTAKRGPNKSPDFVAQDTSGVWHIVECKGTQSGTKYSKDQLGMAGPPPTGGIAQKRSIEFPPGHTGQRLVSGLSIGVEDGDRSRLTIIDPEPDEPFRLDEAQIYLAEDAAARGVVSKALRLSGFETTAEATAAPLGMYPWTMRSRMRRQEEARSEYVDMRGARAQEELERAERPGAFSENGYRGREQRITLPRPVMLEDSEVTRVVLRQAINADILAQLRENPTSPDPDFGSFAANAGADTRNTAKGDARSASLRIGDLFRSEIFLD